MFLVTACANSTANAEREVACEILNAYVETMKMSIAGNEVLSGQALADITQMIGQAKAAVSGTGDATNDGLSTALGESYRQDYPYTPSVGAILELTSKYCAA